MLSKKKGLLALCFSLVLAFAMSSSVFAVEASPPTQSISMQFPSTFQSAINSGKKSTYVITDKAQLKKLAAEKGLSEVPEKIEYEFQPTANVISSTPASTSLIEKSNTVATSDEVYWANKQDYGSGWYYSDNPYKTFIIDGPDTFVYSEKKTDTTNWNGTFGMSVSALKAEIGFSSGETREVQFTSNTPVKANQRLTAKLFVTYHKVGYSVFYGPYKDQNHSVCTGAGFAWEGNGTLIEKIFNPPN